MIVLHDIDGIRKIMDQYEGYRICALAYRYGFMEYLLRTQEDSTDCTELFEAQIEFPGICLVRPNKHVYVKMPLQVVTELLRDKDFPFTINKTGKIMRKNNNGN